MSADTSSLQFSPSAEVAISCFLRLWIQGRPLHPGAAGRIHHAQVYACDPKDLAAKFPRLRNTHDRYFFSTVRCLPQQRKGLPYRMMRAAGEGTWSSQGKRNKDVLNQSGERIGFYETLSFKRKWCSSTSGWLMEEYHCAEQEAADVEEERVLCKVYVSKLKTANAARQESAAGDRAQAPRPSQAPAPAIAQQPRAFKPITANPMQAAVPVRPVPALPSVRATVPTCPMSASAPQLPSPSVRAAVPTRPLSEYPPQLPHRRYMAPCPSHKHLPETIAAEPPCPNPKQVPKRAAPVAADPPCLKRARPAASTRPAPPPPPSAPLALPPICRQPSWCRPPLPGLLTAPLPPLPTEDLDDFAKMLEEDLDKNVEVEPVVDVGEEFARILTPPSTGAEDLDDFAKMLEEDLDNNVEVEPEVDVDKVFARMLEEDLDKNVEVEPEDKEMAEHAETPCSLGGPTALDDIGEEVMEQAAAAYDMFTNIHLEEDDGFDASVPLSAYTLDLDHGFCC